MHFSKMSARSNKPLYFRKLIKTAYYSTYFINPMYRMGNTRSFFTVKTNLNLNQTRRFQAFILSLPVMTSQWKNTLHITASKADPSSPLITRDYCETDLSTCLAPSAAITTEKATRKIIYKVSTHRNNNKKTSAKV